MSLGVVGTENRAVMVAAVAASQSGEVTLFETRTSPGRTRVDVVGVSGDATLTLMGVMKGEPLEADAYILAAAASEFAGVLYPRRRDIAGRPLLLVPGGFGGVLRVRGLFAEWGLRPPIVAEGTGWLAGGWWEGETTIRVAVRKHNMPVAGMTDIDTENVIAALLRYIPDLTPSDLITTSLSNVNTIGHPALAVCNVTRMENGEVYNQWGAGFSNAVGKLMRAIDGERMSVLDALGRTSEPLFVLMSHYYAADGFAGPDLETALRSFPGYQNYPGPAALDVRYLTDDIPFGLAAFEELASRLGLKHDVATSVRQISEVLLGRSLKAPTDLVDEFLAYVLSERKVSATEPPM